MLVWKDDDDVKGWVVDWMAVGLMEETSGSQMDIQTVK